MAKHPPHILEWAKRGAEARLRDLIQEGQLLLDLFPHLKDAFDPDELPISFIVKRDARRPRMSIAARKAVSVRMKKYWAARRKAKKT